VDLEPGGSEASDRMCGHFVRKSHHGLVEKDAQLALELLQRQFVEAAPALCTERSQPHVISLAGASQLSPAIVATPGHVVAVPQQRSPEVVIFLDTDGVLHSLYGDGLFNDSCVSLLADLIEQTQASVVLSSSWRTDSNKMRMVNAALKKPGPRLAKHGLLPQVLAW